VTLNFTLTPALSLREREKGGSVLALREREKGGSVHNLSPLPEGEGERPVRARSVPSP